MRILLRDSRQCDRKLFCLAGDVSKAHSRIKVKSQDWGFQACRLREGRAWLNKVGTYGVTLAAYFWSRVAAAFLVRLPYLLPDPGLALEIPPVCR